MGRESAFLIVLLIILLVSLASAIEVQGVEASGTIYIRADGSIDPPTAPIYTADNVTYTLTGNITADTDGIVIERDNIVVDGAGYTLTGSVNGNGATLTDRSNVTVRNMTIINFGHGIWLDSSSNNTLSGNNVTANTGWGILGYGIGLYHSSNNTLSGNNVTNNEYGMYIESSPDNTLSGNNISGNDEAGIWLYSSPNNVLSGNAVEGSQRNLLISGGTLSDYLLSIDTSNLVDSKPVYYFVNQSDMVVDTDTYPKVGYLGFVNCVNVTMQGLNLTGNGDGLLLAFTNNSKITGNNVTNQSVGIWLDYSFDITLSDNNITNNVHGVRPSDSSNITLSDNNITNNRYGVQSYDSSNITLSGNDIAYNGFGVYVDSTSNITLSSNNVTYNSECGIMLFGWSQNNTLSGNNVTNNGNGIELWQYSSYNTLSGNNVTNNGEGIGLASSNINILSGNNVTNNGNGIGLYGSAYNTLSGNNVTNNGNGIILSEFHSLNNRVFGNNIASNRCGINLSDCSDNRIFHNNFLDNTEQAASNSSANVWDDGYPSSGNYWSDYNGTDADHDGIGDTPYVIDVNNTDSCPLMGMFHSFNVSWVDSGYFVDLISNSTISRFDVGVWIEHPEDPNTRIIGFNVTGEDDTIGFCRILIPTALMNGTYTVFVNRLEIVSNLLPGSNSTHSYLYFNYTHSTQEVTIIPEFPSFLILPLFFIATLLAVIVYRIKHF